MAPDGAVAIPALAPARAEQAELRAEIVRGLSARQKRLPTRLLYDAHGSRLFEAICRLPEYYLTRTELSILQQHAGAIAEFLGAHCVLLEPGAGNGEKTRVLLAALQQPAAYVPIDIAAEPLARCARGLRRDFPDLRVVPVCADFTQPLQQALSAHVLVGRHALFFPGSTIGNFEPPAAQRLLASWRAMAGPEARLVIGFDLWKDAAVLQRAYDDGAGITAQFNLNMLGRLNREFDADFNLQCFAHHARVNAREQRVEMYLVSLRPQQVRVAGHRFELAAGEAIHTENSYKYTASALCRLASAAGWDFRERWLDDGRLYNVHAYEARR